MLRIIILTILATNAFTLPTNLYIDERILGGGEAAIGQFPSHVALILGEDQYQCGGNIVTSLWVVTAAHCIKGLSPYAFTILVGSNDLKGEGGDRYAVWKLIVHEGYDVKTKQHDLGMVRTKEEMVFSELVKPIPLNTEILPPGAVVTIAGWGYTSWPGTTPDKMQFINSNVMNWLDCAMHFIFDYPITEDQICTYTRRGEGMCGGDSGSGVLYLGKLAASVSWGIPCGRGEPDVHTNTSSHVEWIQKNSQ